MGYLYPLQPWNGEDRLFFCNGAESMCELLSSVKADCGAMRTRFNSCIKNVSNHIQKGIPRVIVKKFLFRDLRLVVAFLAVGNEVALLEQMALG